MADTEMIDKVLSDRYRIVEVIGSGGMADVYKAYDQAEDRIVAVKVLKQEHRGDADFVRRFAHEAKAVLSLSHENIVRSLDVGQEGDISYIVFEYVDGSTLKEIIREEGPLTPREAVSVASQVLNALEHAHACGIIHRDVKPQNVMITHEGAAKLADFGIARDAGATTRTFAGTNVIGSVHYLSPEQARGDQVDAKSDIYSCGIMLYEMLTGKVPFAGDNSVAIALKHLQEEIKPPVLLNSRIPRALSDVVVKATAKKPEQRYASAAAMREDLQRALREPHGKFARIKVEQSGEKSEAPVRKTMNIGNLTLFIVLALGMFAALFFTVRAMRESKLIAKNDYVVPVLQGKKIAEAKELASLRGFILEESERAPSDEYAEGVVLNQTPASGTNGKAGDKITVTVSSGSNHTVAPDLTGLTLQDAVVALAEAELKLGAPTYMPSDLPDGQIISQDPVADTQIYKGDVVDIWISGQQDQNAAVPPLTGLPVDTAVREAKNSGFTQIRIYPVAPEDASAEDTVMRQSPAEGLRVSKNLPVELYINRTHLGNYAADIAFNIDIELPDMPVIVTAKLSEGAEIVLYTATPSVGAQQPVSFTGYMREPGEYECKVYVAGSEVRSNMIVFSAK